MTYPDTSKAAAAVHNSGPPHYPSSQQLPPEFWRDPIPGNPANTQTISIDNGTELVKREVEPGWDKPVTFSSDAGD